MTEKVKSTRLGSQLTLAHKIDGDVYMKKCLSESNEVSQVQGIRTHELSGEGVL
ncbi:hypothetical protein J2T12_003974 [Paenibacillus anaericanus]|uniref:hypothetical protein n=1 Tax=Paenibacillus anaericanus TaxID=170367 RepID=UPI002785AE7C|nr:hypothetical protein [Paenibacillus anaericanus]MDQ0090551.1 hypothetical protein [Paenibacillus anaericanus]